VYILWRVFYKNNDGVSTFADFADVEILEDFVTRLYNPDNQQTVKVVPIYVKEVENTDES
jgi:hypothetical protein